MSEVNGITSVESKNTYINATNKNSVQATDFSSFLGETKSMDSIFKEAADKYNVSVDFLKAIGKAESNFNPNAVSRCGAQGVMQLMPATAKELGVTDAFDAEQNIMGGAKYISGLLKKYDGNTSLALAAYNAGSGNVKKYGGIPPFKETQNYVKKVIGYMNNGVDTNGIMVKSSNKENTNSSDNVVAASKTTITQAPKIATNMSYLLSNQIGDTNLQDLDLLLTYEDYLRFIEIFMDNDQNEETKEDNSYNPKDITYNMPVMNLLKNQNLI